MSTYRCVIRGRASRQRCRYERSGRVTSDDCCVRTCRYRYAPAASVLTRALIGGGRWWVGGDYTTPSTPPPRPIRDTGRHRRRRGRKSFGRGAPAHTAPTVGVGLNS